MVKFVMTQAICPEGIEKLKADTNNDVNIYVADNQDPNNYLDEMQDADALIVRIAKCDAHAIENSPNLKVIGRTGIGYDSVDVKKATELGIPVVVAINMMDVVKKNGDQIFIDKLSEVLGCKVVEISALKGTGVKEAAEAAVQAAQANKAQQIVHTFDKKVEEALARGQEGQSGDYRYLVQYGFHGIAC